MTLGIVSPCELSLPLCQRFKAQGAGFALLTEDAEIVSELECETAASLPLLIQRMQKPRLLWLMGNNRDQTQRTVNMALLELEPGDVLADSVSSHFLSTMHNAKRCAEREIGFIDVGYKGNAWGIRHGFALMVGGNRQHLQVAAPFLNLLAPAPDNGWLHCGTAGAGQFLRKLQHTVEQAIMLATHHAQSSLQSSLEFTPEVIIDIWRQGGELRLAILDLTTEYIEATERHPPFESYFFPDQLSDIAPNSCSTASPALNIARALRFAAETSIDLETRLITAFCNSHQSDSTTDHRQKERI